MLKNEFSARGADMDSFADSVQGTHAGAAAEELAEIIAEAIRRALPSIRVYVLESDITASQNAVKTVVEHSRF